MCQISKNSFDCGTNFGLTGKKYFIDMIFATKTEIGIMEITNGPNFSKF